MDTPANFAGVKPSIDRPTLWPNPIPPARCVEFVLECLADFGLETLPRF